MACVIPDLVHLHAGMLALVLCCKGPAGVVLVTDSIAAAGLPDGDYHLAGQSVTVHAGQCRDAAGHLSGSSLCFDQGLERFRSATPIGPVGAALVSATNAARALGREQDVGSLLPHRRADLLEWSEQADRLRLRRVRLGGRVVTELP
jgi:N-acetylglucosamine-6-phosphate deacetylase